MFAAVTRPGRYLGHEAGLRAAGGARLKFLLCFPDLYEIGLSNLGIRILYHVINSTDDLRADLAFAPWKDMHDFMKAERIPLYGLGSGLPARDFDVMGFSLQHELQYANVLSMLDLAGIPVEAASRTEADPLIVAGGPCAFNPEPMSDFIDAFAMGDGESLVIEIGRVLDGARDRGLARAARLQLLSEIQGVYVPGVSARDPARPVARRIEPVLRDSDFPMPPLVPIVPITHDRLTLEIMRGCTRGCRFCSAGMLARPVRERSVDSVVDLARRGIEATGWEEVSLVSLSTSDYADLEQLVSRLSGVLDERRVGISLPSMRPGTFSDEVARMVGRTRKTGLTFAPEAGSDRLRKRVNKDGDERELYSTIETAFRGGWDSLKLYFMVGLPGEDDTDIEGLVKMAKSVGAICRGFGKRRHATVSLSPFVPRAHTPLQWEAQCLPEETLRRINLIRRSLPEDRIKLKWRDPYMSLVEGLLARGDRRFGRAIAAAWKAGAGFDSWTDRFDFGLWSRSFQAAGIDIEASVAGRDRRQPLPWGHVGAGVTPEFLRSEADRADAGTLTPDCRDGSCSGCGACPGVGEAPGQRAAAPEASSTALRGAVRAGRPPNPPVSMRLRVRYAKEDQLRFASHLDVTRSIQRGLRRSGLAVCYSEGYSPHPRLSFGPPLPLGVAGYGEYFDVALGEKPGAGWMAALNQSLPAGLTVLEGKVAPVHGPSLMTMLNTAEYRILLLDCDGKTGQALAEAVRAAVGERGLITLHHGPAEGGYGLELVARLKLESGAAEKGIDRAVRQAGPFKLVRMGLYFEKDKTMYTPFGELRKDQR